MTQPNLEEFTTREFNFRAETADDEQREVVGIAVPWDTDTNVGYYTERVAKGAVLPRNDQKLFWQHSEPIGLITSSRDTDDGWEITARISTTPRGDEAYQLVKDGVIDRFSIGFEPVVSEYNEQTDTVTRTQIDVREVSLVAFPAYEGATLTEVRERATNAKEIPSMTDITQADMTEVRQQIEDLSRRFEEGISIRPEPSTPLDQFRSAGEFLKAVVGGDEQAIRAYNGAITTDAVLKAAWIGDLVEILKKKRPVIGTFATGPIPSEGMSVEYARLKSNTTSVTQQAAEGDDLAFGKVAIETATAPIETIGGYSTLSRQVIERSSVGILDTTLEALAEAYSRRSEIYARGVLDAAYAASGGAALQTVSTAATVTQNSLVELVLNLAEKFEDNGRVLDGLFVDKATFLAWYGVTSTDRILQISGSSFRDQVGTINVQSANGTIAGLEIRVLPGAASGFRLAYDKSAFKTLEVGGAPFRLQDENIINLSKDFSLYGYVSAFVQKADGLVKVVNAG